MRLKIIISSICFIILSFFVTVFLSKIITMSEYYREEKDRMEIFYKEPQKSVDAIFIGPSSTYCAWNPLFAWKDFGITSLLLSFPALPNSANIYYLKEINKKQTPKLIIINADNMPYKLEKENHKETIGFISSFRLCLNKYLMVNAINNEFKVLNFNKFEQLELFFPIIYLHNQWKKVYSRTTNELSFPITQKKTAAFFDGYFEREYKTQDKTDNANKLTPSAIKIIRELFEYINTIDTPVLLINTPKADYFYDQYTYNLTEEEYDKIFKLADEYNIPYINLHDKNAMKKMNIKPEDLMNGTHLNYKGSAKYTKYLAEILKEKYNFEDKRNDKKFASWNEAFNEYSLQLYLKYNINFYTNYIVKLNDLKD